MSKITNLNFNDTQKIIFFSPVDKTEKFAKLNGRRIKIKEKEYIQFERFYNNQAYHENICRKAGFCDAFTARSGRINVI